MIILFLYGFSLSNSCLGLIKSEYINIQNMEEYWVILEKSSAIHSICASTMISCFTILSVERHRLDSIYHIYHTTNMYRIDCCSHVSHLTHWGRVTHICVGKLTNIGSDNGLSPGRRQAIVWTNDGLLLFGPLGTNFSEILIEILTFSFKKRRLIVSSAKRRPFCFGLNALTHLTVKMYQQPIVYWSLQTLCRVP